MNSEEKLAAYEKMQCAIETEYESIVNQMERLKSEDKTKSVTYKQLIARKLTYGNMLNMYELYDLK